VPRGFAWDADGQSLVYADGSKTNRLFLASGKDVVLVDSSDTDASLGVAVSPDGNTIFLPERVSHTRRTLITNFGDRPRPQ